MSHTQRLRHTMMMSVVLLASIVAAPLSIAKTPNILLIYVDDLGYGDLGSSGHPTIQTPNIDALAAEGMTLKNYYAPSALCSPSRAGVLTGRAPYRTGIKSWIPQDSGIFLRDEEITLAELLKGRGYATALIGKWHLNSDLGSDSEPQPTDQGFDYFYGHNAFQIPTNKNPTNIYRGKQRLPAQSGYTAQLYADEAISWLEAHDEEQPFFLFLSMAEPHTPIENPPEYNAMYAAFTRGEVVPIPSGQDIPPAELLVPRGPGEYYANITYMDAQLGRVLAWLDRRQIADDTIVVFTSDNGPVTSAWYRWYEINSYGSTGGFRGRKHLLFEGGIKVPAIVRYPGAVKAGTTSDALVVGTDWFNTLAAAAGASVPTDRPIDGIDIHEVLEGRELPSRSLVWALDSVSELEFAVRDGDWKLLIDRQGSPRELYDLANDPGEFFQLQDERPEVVERLMEVFNAQRYLRVDAD
ncbi:MAG: sulfatase-like hydrolase/transferase [Pseudomonadota bacterium]